MKVRSGTRSSDRYRAAVRSSATSRLDEAAGEVALSGPDQAPRPGEPEVLAAE
ncbi:hypothetical protein HBB16_20885 [Pseudonocardia sp. MCCB 268]|nr:hypothetical protein [Pseudonocardia cytotoxica]